MNEAYLYGFMEKCAEYNMDPEFVLKQAQVEPGLIKQILTWISKLGGRGVGLGRAAIGGEKAVAGAQQGMRQARQALKGTMQTPVDFAQGNPALIEWLRGVRDNPGLQELIKGDASLLSRVGKYTNPMMEQRQQASQAAKGFRQISQGAKDWEKVKPYAPLAGLGAAGGLGLGAYSAMGGDE